MPRRPAATAPPAKVAPAAKAAPAPVAPAVKAAPAPVAPAAKVGPRPEAKVGPRPEVRKPAYAAQATSGKISTVRQGQSSAHARSGTVRTASSAVASAAAPSAPAEVVRPSPQPRVPQVKPTDPNTPLVIIRKSAAEAAPVKDAVRAPEAPPRRERSRPAPKPRPAPKAAPAPAAPKKERKEKRKDAEKRERKHRRHSKRVNRRAASLDLKDGEKVSLSIEGWSRFRRATLVVTNYRVALITRMPPQVRWIPLEEVATISRRWRGAHSILVAAPTEVFTMQKAKGQMLASFQELLESEVKEARRPGTMQRHHADITQEWCDRSTQIWDSSFHRIRLWIRRRPVVTFFGVIALGIGAFYLTSVMTSVFSPVR